MQGIISQELLLPFPFVYFCLQISAGELSVAITSVYSVRTRPKYQTYSTITDSKY